MAMIVLAKPVQVPIGNGKFVTAKAGSKVNYSCSKHDNGAWIHKFTFWSWNEQRLLTYTEAGDQSRPDWM